MLCTDTPNLRNSPSLSRRMASSSTSLFEFFAQEVSNNLGYPYFCFTSIILSTIALSLCLNIPKFALDEFNISTLFFPAHSISPNTRSKSNFLTLLNVVPPQSQKVHLYGHPLSVSTMALIL